jgi:hypothetical protein
MKFEVTVAKTDSLIPYENNPRINEKAVQRVVDSVQNFGWKVPIVIDENNIVLAGHTRLKAAEMMNLKEVPVHIAKDMTDEQKTAFRIMDNKSQEYAEWDNKLLSAEFEKLALGDYDFEMTGFDIEAINKITKGAFLEFDAPELEISESDFLSQDVYIPETNVKQYMLLFNISDIEEFKKMIEVLRDIYKIESPSDIVFKAVKNECEKNTNL